jgi:hypothetical protein
MIMFVGAHLLIAVAIGCGLVGWSGPVWSQRMGNLVVVLSMVALLIKPGAPADYVFIGYFDVWSCVLGIIGAFWGAIGEIVCRGVRSPEGLKETLRKAINQ